MNIVVDDLSGPQIAEFMETRDQRGTWAACFSGGGGARVDVAGRASQ